MRILALETSQMAGSVAALDAGRLVCEQRLDPATRSAQSLAPTMRDVLAEVGWRPAEVELLAVTIGPGSFTGLRVGLATARAFAYAVQCQILGVNTLQVLAAQAPAGVERVWTALDAQRKEVFYAELKRGSGDQPGVWRFRQETALAGEEEFLAMLRPGAVVTGLGLERIATRLPGGARALDTELWRPMAAAVGSVAWSEFTAGRRDELFELAPRYFRGSAAEEQWARRAASSQQPDGAGSAS